ncbi:FkbM family methyltransferase [Natrialbaceae archaeon AArc-T1-2]|uniref:FkbM family methyltransferase n=1 Tax=Natrialbaceae archaeon AArc-T1-2 TaxID=3053904 RepID=UPI00255B28B6|nr:FkbM family methyltransferase [Natrialbaceae archaeon AArc-T1-2]WIV67494.1 FkbM family methyltransferase [Natrialbaceae archaeon AArc-T1-2]
MELLRKASALVSRPGQVLRHAKQGANELFRLVRTRRPGAIGSFIAAGATGRSPYDVYIRYLAGRTGGTVSREINGHEMVLNLEDGGLSRDLLVYGTREQRTIELFERALRRIDAMTAAPVTVLEIGANIGYYALAEARAVGPDGRVLAFEPDDRNVRYLEQNVRLNGYEDRITIEPAAVGPESGTAELRLSTHTNLNRIESASTDGDRRDADDSERVDVWSVEEYLTSREIPAGSIHAVRMDLEGYEAELVPAMESVLGAPGPLLVLVEMHPNILTTADTERVLRTFDRHGFEIVAVVFEEITSKPLVAPRQYESFESLRSLSGGYNLLVRKGV